MVYIDSNQAPGFLFGNLFNLAYRVFEIQNPCQLEYLSSSTSSENQHLDSKEGRKKLFHILIRDTSRCNFLEGEMDAKQSFKGKGKKGQGGRGQRTLIDRRVKGIKSKGNI